MNDRNGKPYGVGTAVRVQECAGRYGQVQIVEGVITHVYTLPPGLTLRLTLPARRTGRDSLQHYAAGESVYVSLPDNGAYQHFDDVEHGHETWVEVKP